MPVIEVSAEAGAQASAQFVAIDLHYVEVYA